MKISAQDSGGTQNVDLVIGGSNEIVIFGRIVAFLVLNASEFQGVSFDTPYDILI